MDPPVDVGTVGSGRWIPSDNHADGGRRAFGQIRDLPRKHFGKTVWNCSEDFAPIANNHSSLTSVVTDGGKLTLFSTFRETSEAECEIHAQSLIY